MNLNLNLNVDISLGGSKIKEEIIFRAEELSDKTKIPVEEVYEKIAEVMPQYNEILEDLRKGKPKSEVYDGYLSDDVIEIIRAGERRGIVVSSLIAEVWRAKREIQELKSQFRKSIVFPVFYFAFIAVASFFILTNIEGKFREVDLIKDWTLFNMLKTSYVPLSLFIFLFFLLAVIRPDLFPLTRGAYKQVEGAFVLNLTRFFYKAGLPIQEIIGYFRDMGGFIAKAFDFVEESIEGFIIASENFLDVEESAVINAGFKVGRFQEVLEGVALNKVARAKDGVEKMGKIMFYIALGLSGVPVFFVLAGYGSLFIQVVSNVMGAGM